MERLRMIIRKLVILFIKSFEKLISSDQFEK